MGTCWKLEPIVYIWHVGILFFHNVKTLVHFFPKKPFVWLSHCFHTKVPKVFLKPHCTTMFLFCKFIHCHIGFFCGDKNVDFVIINFLLTKFIATKATILGPQGYCIFKCIINLAMLFRFKNIYLVMVFWNGSRISFRCLERW